MAFGKGGNKTPVAPGAVNYQTVLSKPAVYGPKFQDAAVLQTAIEQQKRANATNEANEVRPESLKQWRGVVTAISSDSRSAQVRLAGDTSAFWAPLEVSGAAVDSRVVIDFRPEGGVAVIAIVQ